MRSDRMCRAVMLLLLPLVLAGCGAGPVTVTSSDAAIADRSGAPQLADHVSALRTSPPVVVRELDDRSRLVVESPVAGTICIGVETDVADTSTIGNICTDSTNARPGLIGTAGPYGGPQYLIGLTAPGVGVAVDSGRGGPIDLIMIDDGLPGGLRAFVGTAGSSQLLVRFTDEDGGDVLGEVTIGD